MSDRALSGRHSRVSPVPGRGSSVAYSPCPEADPDGIMSGNVLAIPMSSINTTFNINNNNNMTGSSNTLVPKTMPGETNSANYSLYTCGNACSFLCVAFRRFVIICGLISNALTFELKLYI